MPFIVWGTWATVALAALAYVALFGSDVPFWDEWNLIDVLTGSQPVTLQWLWSPHNGHRIPLPRLLLLGLYKLSGTDFRAGMYFNVVALAAASAALIWASQRGRSGRIALADAVFPLLLLHWGHYQNLLWSWQTTQVLPVAVVCGVLALVAAYGLSPPTWSATLTALSVLTLPLSGIPGLAYAPALAALVAIVGATMYCGGRRKWAVALWVVAALTLALVIVYFHGYDTNSTASLSLPSPGLALKTALKFAAGGLGPGAEKLWPAVGFVTAAVLIATGALLGLASFHSRLPLRRALALLLFFFALTCLIAAISVGRPGAGFVGRYFVLAAPIWCAAFLAWPSAVDSWIAQRAQFCFLLVVIALTPLNIRAGLRYARDYHERMEAFRSDLLAAKSPGELVAWHVATLYPCPWWGFAKAGIHQRWGNLPRNTGFPAMEAVSFHDWMTANLRKLHDAKIGDYAQMQTNKTPLREIAPTAANGFAIDRAAGANAATGTQDSAVLLTPESPLYVAGVRVSRPADSGYIPASETNKPWVQVFWRSPGEPAYMVPNRYVFLWSPGQDEQIVWMYRVVTQLALHVGDAHVQRRLGPDELPLAVLVSATADQ